MFRIINTNISNFKRLNVTIKAVDNLINQKCLYSIATIQIRENCFKFNPPNVHKTLIIKRNMSFIETLTYCKPVAYVQELLINFHNLSGLHWWSTIILFTVIARLLIAFPLAIYQNRIVSKVENITLLEMPEIRDDIFIKAKRISLEKNWDERKTKLYLSREIKQKWNELIVRDNCHPFKATILLWFQIPTWIFLSTSLRNIAYMLPHRDTAAEVTFLELSVGGFGIIPNLIMPDGTLFLPVLFGLTNLTIIEIQNMMNLNKKSKWRTFLINIFRGFSIILIPVAANMPACVCLYWTTSSLIGLTQNLFLMSNKVRTTFGIPETPSTLEHPYKQLLYEIKQKGNFFKKFKN